MSGHYRRRATIMHDSLNTTLLLLQEGERQNISFAENTAGTAPAQTASTVSQEGAAATGQEGGTGSTPVGSGNSLWIMIGLLFLFMWFFVIRPENKRQKEKRNFQSSLGKGDKVVMVSGLHGTVASIDENTISLKVADNLRLQYDRVAVARQASAPAEAKGKGEDAGSKKK